MPRTFRIRIAAGLLVYAVLIAAGILTLGHWANEGIESSIWRTLLGNEMQQLLLRRQQDPGAPLPSSGNLHTYVGTAGQPPAGLPTALSTLAPGMHEEVRWDQGEAVVLVHDQGPARYYLVMDITALEANERTTTGWLLLTTLVVTFGLAALGWWMSGQLLRPLSTLVQDIDRIGPAARGERLRDDRGRGDEIATLTHSVNGLLDRIDGFVKREHAFITTASHELRTPIASIAGAVDIAITQPDLPDAVRKPLHRIQRASRDIDQLIHVLLVLAKSPERIMEGAEEFDLAALVQDVVADHQTMTQSKSLTMRTERLIESRLRAPQGIVRIAIANLVRNAVQHSDHGVISVSIDEAGVVRVVDPGHGMPPEAVSRHYMQLIRSGDPGLANGGIGLELLARICTHLGWSLDLQASASKGTVAVLDLRPSLLDVCSE